MNLKETIEKAKSENKLTFMIVGRPTCSDCRGVKSILNNPKHKVNKTLNQNYVFYDCNIDKSEEWKPYTKMEKFALPLIVLINPKTNKTKQMYGSLTPSTLEAHLRGFIKSSSK